MKFKPITLLFVLFMLSLYSCDSSKKVVYLQDLSASGSESIKPVEIVAQPKDKISIVVSSRDPQLTAIFNLPRARNYIGDNNNTNYSSNGEIVPYQVDDEGNIDFPVIGVLHVAGMTKYQIASLVKSKLTEANLVKEPIVTADFINLHVSIMGEVKTPGQVTIDRDQLNLLEALTKAGDMTIYGRRDSVLVIREEAGVRNIYSLDLRSKNMFSSPGYYLKQNDMVYVKPNVTRAGQSTINDNNVKSVSLWLSIGSFLTTLAVLIFK